MLDFSSSLYLGFRHGSDSLLPWPTLTLGRPAALGELSGSRAVAHALATLQGCERAVLAPSSLHLAWDLFVTLAAPASRVFVDREAYPVLRWGVERAAARGIPVSTFAHLDATDLRHQMSTCRETRPIVVTDGFCSSCGRLAPLRAYLDAVRRVGGLMVIDDTQALGVLGRHLSLAQPYGAGGGGSLQHAGVTGPDILVVSSLAKAFGVPIAVLAGGSLAVQTFVARSETRVYSSPPSAAAIHAAARALSINTATGDLLRSRLLELVRYFTDRLRDLGFPARGLFPVQSLGGASDLDPVTLHDRLRRNGIATIVQGRHGPHKTRVSFIITARHRVDQLDRALAIVAAERWSAAANLGEREDHRWTSAP